MLKTFDEWSSLGYKIKAGSKSIKQNGQNLFKDTQVELYRGSSWYRFSGGEDYDEEDSIYYYLAPNHF